MVQKRFILVSLAFAALLSAPVFSSFAEDAPVYRYRESDDRMSGSVRAKAAMQRYEDDEDSKPRKTTSTSSKPKKSSTPVPEKKPENTDLEAATDRQTAKKAADDAEKSDQNVVKEDAVTVAPKEESKAAKEDSGEQTTQEPDDQIVSRSSSPARVPAVLKVNYTTLESLGTLSNAGSGSLGIDLWDGSTRHQILQLVNQLPSPRHYGMLQRLNQRALLTSADATLMGNRGGIQAGEDFQTVRIEKLLDTGSYLQASQLYMTDQAVAYHERLARAGVQSLFLSLQPTVACLETKTLMVRFENQPFWNQASVICDYILGKMAGHNMKNFADRPEIKPVAKESRVMAYVFDKPGYKITPRNFDDLKDYTPLEIALLLNDRRISLAKLDIDGLENVPSHTLGVMMMVPEASGEVKLRLWDEALRRGMITPAELGGIYAGIKLDDISPAKAKGWLMIPAYYQSMTAAREKEQKQKIGQEALKLAGQFPAGALTPFAEHIPTISAEGVDPALIRRITRVGLLAGTPVSRSFERNLWSQAESLSGNNEALWLAIANAALQNFSTEEMPKNDVFQELTGKLPETSKTLVFALIEKLDTTGKLHNSVTKVAYEKQDGLTSPTDYDYVMPSSDLMDNLAAANKDRRLGEVILLSSIAIGDIAPSKLDPAVMAEVIDGLKTVGLTSEARELASEVILGLSSEK